jgi:hypothetical protein
MHYTRPDETRAAQQVQEALTMAGRSFGFTVFLHKIEGRFYVVIRDEVANSIDRAYAIEAVDRHVVAARDWDYASWRNVTPVTEGLPVAVWYFLQKGRSDIARQNGLPVLRDDQRKVLEELAEDDRPHDRPNLTPEQREVLDVAARLGFVP